MHRFRLIRMRQDSVIKQERRWSIMVNRAKHPVPVAIVSMLVIALVLTTAGPSLTGYGTVYAQPEQAPRTRYRAYFPIYLKSGAFLFPVEYSIPYTLAPARTAIETLLAGVPENPYIPNLIPEGTLVRGITIKDGLCTVDFSSHIQRANVGAGGEAILLQAIVNTLAQFGNVTSVKILVEGQPVETLAGHIDISGPLTPEFQPGFQSFPDVQQHWAGGYTSILQVLDIIDGYEDNTFRPERKVTRAELVKLLVEALELPFESKIESMPFQDVPESHWSRNYVARALSAGLISPDDYKNGFRPDEVITREEMAFILVKAHDAYLANNPGTHAKAVSVEPFSDETDVSLKYLEAVGTAAKRALLDGYPDGSFGPRRGLTRAETTTVIARLLGIEGQQVILMKSSGRSAEDSDGVLVLGAAAAFEGTVSIRGKNSAGETVFTDYTTATQGQGWGVFGFSVAKGRLTGQGPCKIEVYLESAKDGSEYSVQVITTGISDNK